RKLFAADTTAITAPSLLQIGRRRHAGGRAAIRRKRFAVYYLAFGFQRLLSLRHYLRPLIVPVFPKWRSIHSRRTAESRLPLPSSRALDRVHDFRLCLFNSEGTRRDDPSEMHNIKSICHLDWIAVRLLDG